MIGFMHCLVLFYTQRHIVVSVGYFRVTCVIRGCFKSFVYFII